MSKPIVIFERPRDVRVVLYEELNDGELKIGLTAECHHTDALGADSWRHTTETNGIFRDAILSLCERLGLCPEPDEEEL